MCFVCNSSLCSFTEYFLCWGSVVTQVKKLGILAPSTIPVATHLRRLGKKFGEPLTCAMTLPRRCPMPRQAQAPENPDASTVRVQIAGGKNKGRSKLGSTGFPTQVGGRV